MHPLATDHWQRALEIDESLGPLSASSTQGEDPLQTHQTERHTQRLLDFALRVKYSHDARFPGPRVIETI